MNCVLLFTGSTVHWQEMLGDCLPAPVHAPAAWWRCTVGSSRSDLAVDQEAAHDALQLRCGCGMGMRLTHWQCLCWLFPLQDYWRNCKRRPVFMLGLPVLTFVVLCALSVLGVVLGADKYETDMRQTAESTAVDWVRLTDRHSAQHESHDLTATYGAYQQ